MNVKEHKWLVWLVVVSLVAGMWSGSVARGEETSPGDNAQKVREIMKMEIGMEELVKGKLLPSVVTVKEIQVESSSIEAPVVETISTESVTVETSTISWNSRKEKDGPFEGIRDWQKHQVENNTEYKVEMTLNTEGCIFKENVVVYMGKQLGTVETENSAGENSVTVSWRFIVGKLAASTPSATASSTVKPPIRTETPQPETITIESVHIDGVSPPVGGEAFPKKKLNITMNLSTKEIFEETEEPIWKSETGEVIKEEKAAFNETYQLWIQLESKEGYEFAEEFSAGDVSVKDTNKNLISSERIEVEYDREDKTTVTIKCKFMTGEEPTQSTSPVPTQSASPTEEPHPDTPPIESSLPIISPPLPSLAPPATYTVKLEANGGTVSQKFISFTAEEVSKINLPRPTRKNYVFIGWYEGKKRVAKLTEPRNLTLKAQWVTASVEMGYLGTFKWEKFKLSPDVKLTEVSIEKKYKKFVKINNKKKTLKGKKKKYFEKAKLTLKIDGKDVKGVVLKMKLPEPKIEKKRVVYRKRYVIGVYTTYKLTYTYKPGATKVVAEYSYKRNGKYKKLKALSRRKGGSVSVKKGRTVYMRVKIYYGKNAYSESERKPLKG